MRSRSCQCRRAWPGSTTATWHRARSRGRVGHWSTIDEERSVDGGRQRERGRRADHACPTPPPRSACIDELNAADLARGAVHDRSSGSSSGPARCSTSSPPTRSRRSGSSPTSRASCASRRTGSRRQSERDAGRLRRLPRRLPGRRRRAADERGADRGRRGRPADDPVPGEGPRVPDVFVPQPARRTSGRRARGWTGLFPTELLREAVPAGDIHTEEERRLLYVAMTRAQDRLDADHARRRRRDEAPVAVRRRGTC